VQAKNHHLPLKYIDDFDSDEEEDDEQSDECKEQEVQIIPDVPSEESPQRKQDKKPVSLHTNKVHIIDLDNSSGNSSQPKKSVKGAQITLNTRMP